MLKDHLSTGPYGWFCFVTNAGRGTFSSLPCPVLSFIKPWRNVTEKGHSDVQLLVMGDPNFHRAEETSVGRGTEHDEIQMLLEMRTP